jgi:hypothetical protein
MPSDRYFDPAERIAEKQRSRDQDDADLASGRRTAAEIQQTNSFSAGLDLPNATVHVPNLEAWEEPMSTPEPLSVRPATPRLQLALHHDRVEVVNDIGEAVAVHYDELPALIAVLQDLAADMVGHS